MKSDPDSSSLASGNQGSVPWEIAIVRSWRKVAITFAAALSIALVVWQVTHRNLIYLYAFHPETVARASYGQARRVLVLLVVAAALWAVPLALRVLARVRCGSSAGAVHREVLVFSALPLPLLAVPTFEFQHPFYTGCIVILFSLALAWVVARETERVPAFGDITEKQAKLLVGTAIALFAGTIGFIAYWRFITFHAQLCDSSWETNAVWGIIRRGYPTTSVAAFMYDGKPLPAPYFNDHVPLGDYLFAPFFAVYPDARTLVWMQAIFMSMGAIGAYLVGRHWLDSRIGGVIAAWIYVLNPSVQSLCLHDIHPNILAIPGLMLAVGCMLAQRPWLAAGFGLFTALCHEETPIYAAGLGLFWMFSGENRRRFRFGFGLCVIALGLAVFFSSYLMPRFGGKPHWGHFSLFFSEKPSAGNLVSALVLNPLASAMAVTPELKMDYFLISLIPAGGIVFWGWRAVWFALPTLLLLVPSHSPAFFCPGMNYSAPFVPIVLLMGLAGLARWWSLPLDGSRARRFGVTTYVIACALFGNVLYGNIASKSYKLEYGYSPYRRQNQYNYRDMLGYMDALPPYGPVERELWEVIRRVPKNAPVLSSWAINPQLANRDISLAFGYSGGHPAPEERVDYVVVDKLPALQVQSEHHIAYFRNNSRWKVYFENDSGVIFSRVPR